ncbi:MAG TPA: phage holin family protein [Pilimelia sp.]|nr:phage holin family protein [Pilimelia sp.]
MSAMFRTDPSALTDKFGDVAQRSFGQMIGEVADDLSTLLRQEVALAKAELREEAANAGKASGMFAGAGIAGHLVLVFVSLAVYAGLSNVMDGGWAALIVAAVWAVVAAVLFTLGRARMRRLRGMPQTAQTVQQIPEALTPNRGAQ